MDEIPVKMAKLETNGSENRGRGNRGGLRRTFRIVEPNLQPADIIEKTGNIGRAVKLQSNFTKFSLLRSEKFMMYDSVFSQVGLSPKVKLQFIVRVCQENKLPGAFCFDGRRLFTSEKWHGESDIQEFTHDEKKMTLRLVAQILPDTEEYYQMVNVLLNNLQIMMGQERIGKGYFLSPNITKDEVPRNSGPTFFETNSFKVLGGFGTTLQRGTKPNGELTTLLYIERINRVLNDNSVMKAYNRRSIDQLIGRDIITKYNNKTYRISEIKEMSVDEKFEMGGRTLSYAEYFKDRYNIRLSQGDQPFVLTRVKKPMRRERRKPGEEDKEKDKEKEKEKEAPQDKDMTLNIPGELCFLCGFSDQEKSNMDLQKSLGSVLKREPRERLDDIPAFCNWIKSSNNAEEMCNKWELKIDNKPLEIKGRELPPCDVMCGDNKVNLFPARWEHGEFNDIKKRWESFRYGISARAVIVDNAYINYQGDFEEELKDLGFEYLFDNMSDNNPKITRCRAENVQSSLRDVRPWGIDSIILVFMKNDDEKVYTEVKAFTMMTGILTQCVSNKHRYDGNHQQRKLVSKRTYMKIMAKFGYFPWTVDTPSDLKLNILEPTPPTMIVGMDTYQHKSSNKIIQAAVFSIDNCSTYSNFVNQFHGRQESIEALIENLKSFPAELLCQIQARILIFRSGVTNNSEVSAMSTLINRICLRKGMLNPQLIYVIVKKNEKGTRIYNRIRNTCRHSDLMNPNEGTVVDYKIVNTNKLEFYLLSKFDGNFTNYQVETDTGLVTTGGDDGVEKRQFITANELQLLTYRLCHLDFDCMSTSVAPAPVQYAHKLAKFFASDPEGSISYQMQKKLFYI